MISLLFSISVVGGCNRKSAEQRPDPKTAGTRASTPTKITPYLEEGDASSKAGQIIYLNNVHLEPGPTDKAVYAVGPNGGRMFVVLKEAPKIKPNPQARFDVKGSVERTPAASAMRKQWKMKKEEAAEVQKVGVYLEGETISAAGE